MNQDSFLHLSEFDLNLYYTHTYLRLKESTAGGWKWAHLQGFAATSGGMIVSIQTSDGHSKNIELKDAEWDFSIPEAGTYNFKNTAVIFCRVPVRNTHKAISSHNAEFMDIMHPLAAHNAIPTDFYSANTFSWNPAHFQELFDRGQKYSISQAIEKINKKQAMAQALNPRMIISQGILSKMPCLWLKSRLIGELDVARGRIFPTHEAFVNELSYTFKDYNFSI